MLLTCGMRSIHFLDCQAIAIKFSKQIEKVVKSIKKAVLEANEVLDVDEPHITYEEAKDPMSSLYSATAVQSANVPAFRKRQIIDWSCLKARCQAEMSMVKEEKGRFIHFISDQIRLIDKSVVNLTPYQCDIRLNTGLIVCLKKKRMLYCNQIANLVRLWAGILDTTDIQVEEVKRSYETFSGETHSDAEGLCSEEQNNFTLAELDKEEGSFVLEPSSDSDLSQDE